MELIWQMIAIRSLEPWAIHLLGGSIAILAFAYKTLRAENSEEEGKESSPEYLNFKVNQYAIDRLRDPSLPSIGTKPADQIERERWLWASLVTWIRWGRLKRSRKGVLLEHEGMLYETWSARTSQSEKKIREFAELGYEICHLDMPNLPSFQGIRLNAYLGRLERIWSTFPSCEFAMIRMDASRAQLMRLVKTLRELHRLGYRWKPFLFGYFSNKRMENSSSRICLRAIKTSFLVTFNTR